ncbi:U3 small nucleolar RNA-associated protein 14 homolog A isoform X2 [Molothrus aeneus]|uniref:U3 small nucleolar RNA-associated protein 14 homolog A isoform X2 n=1 Tax=Molothrus aeneus TaxID=84833 RepID=UPI00345A5E02
MLLVWCPLITAAWLLGDHFSNARTPLEQEIFGLLHKTQQPVTDPLLTPEEMASVQAMSLEEARRRRAELQKARAVQSYYEAKARRAKRIKSKKYHRVLKKSRRRQALKEFEQLHKSDPAAALARLEELEQLRMQERMSLKHQNKGKWAKSRAIMAKYDLEARKAMQDQLARNKELMQKVRVEPPEEELCEVPEEDTTALPMPSGANPWMLGGPSGLAPEPEAQEGPRDDIVPGAVENKDKMEEEEEELSEEEALLQDFEQKRRERTGSPEGQGRDHGADETEIGAEQPRDSPVPPVCAEELGDSPVPPVCAEELVSTGLEPPPQAQEQLLLSEQLRRVWTMEDVENLAKDELVEEQEKLVVLRAGKQAQQQEEGRAGDRHTKKAPAKRKMISLEAVLDGKPQEMDCPSLPVVLEEEEGGIEQRGMITEAFAGDDVVADFRREKRKAEEAGKPQPVNLVLPGWGEWGGTGLKPSAKKVKRFLIKPPPAPRRKDQHLPHVIMSEKRNIHAAAHQVSELPFPFERHQQFEQSMRTPVGPTWNTQRAFQKLTAPRVITRTGHIIQPISAEDIPDTAPGSEARLEGEAMPSRKAGPGKKAVSRGKAGPGKKAVSRGKAVPGQKAVSRGKAVPGAKAQPRRCRAQ